MKMKKALALALSATMTMGVAMPVMAADYQLRQVQTLLIPLQPRFCPKIMVFLTKVIRICFAQLRLRLKIRIQAIIR